MFNRCCRYTDTFLIEMQVLGRFLVLMRIEANSAPKHALISFFILQWTLKMKKCFLLHGINSGIVSGLYFVLQSIVN